MSLIKLSVLYNNRLELTMSKWKDITKQYLEGAIAADEMVNSIVMAMAEDNEQQAVKHFAPGLRKGWMYIYKGTSSRLEFKEAIPLIGFIKKDESATVFSELEFADDSLRIK